MNRDELDALGALQHRLTEWGVEGATEKAKTFIEALVSRGWVMDAKAKPTPRHPPAREECREHPGEWRINCRAHAADRKAQRDEAEAVAVTTSRLNREQAVAAAREAIRSAQAPPVLGELCRHGTTRATCRDHDTETEPSNEETSQ